MIVRRLQEFKHKIKEKTVFFYTQFQFNIITVFLAFNSTKLWDAQGNG